MMYERIYIRVPVSGEVLLRVGEKIVVKAKVINVSAGGICISAPSQLIGQNEYQVQVITASYGNILFSGFPVYQTQNSIGIKITFIDKENLKTIYRIVESFQVGEGALKLTDQNKNINDRLADEAGEDITITFETKTKGDT